MNLYATPKYYRPTIILLLLVFIVYFGTYHYNILMFQSQLEYREGAALHIVSEILKGNFPYTLKTQPYLSEVYGPLYYFLSVFFVKVFGISLFSLRFFSALCIILSIVWFYFFNFNKGSILLLISYCLVYYINQLFMCIPIARPDSLGLLFFIMSITIPYKKKFTRNSLFLSLLFTLLAFYTKVYFVIGFPVVVLYLFFFQSIKRAFIYLLVFFIIVLGSLIIINFLFDYYILGVFSSHLTGTVYELSHLLHQLKFYYIDFLLIPSCLILVYLVTKLIRNFRLVKEYLEDNFLIENYINLSRFNEPLFKFDYKIDYLGFLIIVFTFLLVFKMGGHTGQFGVYFIQFLSFPLLSLSFQKFHKPFVNYPFITVGLILIILYRLYVVFPKLKDVETSKQNIKLSLTHFRGKSKILTTPIFSSSLIKENQFVYASGLTEYMCYSTKLKKNYGIPRPLSMVKDKLFLHKINSSQKQWENYVKDIQVKVKNQYFDLIVTDTSIYDNWIVPNNDLKINYTLKDSSTIFLFATYQTYVVYFYEPKNKIN